MIERRMAQFVGQMFARKVLGVWQMNSLTPSSGLFFAFKKFAEPF
jgi:hypothetical protein